VTTYTAGRTKDRSLHIIALLSISFIGNILVVSSLNTGVRFFAMFLMPFGAVPAFQIIVAWVANSFLRPNVKRSAAIAICNTAGNSATIYGAYMYPSSDGPRYLPGGAATAGICLCVMALAYVLRVVHMRINKRIAKAEAEGVPDASGVGEGFRYVY
jgi:predicted MFS family arabinose efflux permease